MPSIDVIERLRAEFFADDIEVDNEMSSWTEPELATFFESGGALRPRLTKQPLPVCTRSCPGKRGGIVVDNIDGSECELESARSSIDAAVEGGRAAEHTALASLAEFADEAEAGYDNEGPEPAADEDATEDALIDVPMASVAVTSAAGRTVASESPTAATNGDDVSTWSVRKLKLFLQENSTDASLFTEKADIAREAQRLIAAGATPMPAKGSEGGGGGGGGSCKGGGAAATATLSSASAHPSASVQHARLTRKVEDIKSSGDRAFHSQDYEKADRHYSSALRHAAEGSASLDPVLLAALYSNRSASRAQLNQHTAALDDGHAALRHRPGWARAFSRVGAALFALRRFQEAKANYEAGIAANPHSAELREGLRHTLQRMGTSARGSRSAEAAKLRGNAAFDKGRLEEAIAAYDEAVRLAPSDEVLYSNRSAALAKTGRYAEALADGKRAVSLAPKWGKGYSRAGLAAMRLGDEETAYWFYSNGLRWEARNAELLRGRSVAMELIGAISSARHRSRIERFHRDAHRRPARVFAVSDVHYDHAGAREWASRLSRTAYRDDAIIVAGDVGDTYQAVRLCLRAFREVFRRVFYVPGNHDLWIRPKGQHSDEPSMFADSVAKLIALWQMCDELDVDVGPAQLSPSVVVLPLDSWYSYTFDHHDPRPGSTLWDKFCSWPMGYDDAWQFMTGLNESRLSLVETYASAQSDVITFSHFLPRKELPLPGVLEMAKAAGCLQIEKQLRRAKSKLHIFGHTHINTVNEYDGVRYMQNAMGYGIAPGTKLCVVHDGGRFKDYMA